MFSVLSVFFPSVLAFTLNAQVPAPSAKPAPSPSVAAKPKPSAPAKPAAKEPTQAEQIAGKVQAFYDTTKDFSADFVQLYTRIALSKTSESRGRVKMLKPGMMRWDYKHPEPKHFIADGKQLFVFDPEDQHVTIDPNFQISDQGSSLSFLWGQGKLTNEFNVALGDTKDAPPNCWVLELTPKRDATYLKLTLMVEASGAVLESILHETSGNTNRFRFQNVKTNGALTPATFQFTPPPGAEIQIIRR